jgi:hypothetical protein
VRLPIVIFENKVTHRLDPVDASRILPAGPTPPINNRNNCGYILCFFFACNTMRFVLLF